MERVGLEWGVEAQGEEALASVWALRPCVG